MQSLADELSKYFLGREIEAVAWRDQVHLNVEGPPISAWLVRKTGSGRERAVQVDIRMAVCEGRDIIVSMTGRGTDTAAAVAQAFELFGHGVLEVLTEAFYGIRSDKLYDVNWQIGDRSWYVLYTKWVVTGAGGQWPDPPEIFIERVAGLCGPLRLTPEVHWFSTYQGNFPGRRSVTEVLLDNVPWTAAETALSDCGWPAWDTIYTFRRFFLLQPAFDV